MNPLLTQLLIYLAGLSAMTAMLLAGLWLVLRHGRAVDAAARQVRPGKTDRDEAEDERECLKMIEQWRAGK
jgi:putative exporter of polyketide antibiotics